MLYLVATGEWFLAVISILFNKISSARWVLKYLSRFVVKCWSIIDRRSERSTHISALNHGYKILWGPHKFEHIKKTSMLIESIDCYLKRLKYCIGSVLWATSSNTRAPLPYARLLEKAFEFLRDSSRKTLLSKTNMDIRQDNDVINVVASQIPF